MVPLWQRNKAEVSTYGSSRLIQYVKKAVESLSTVMCTLMILPKVDNNVDELASDFLGKAFGPEVLPLSFSTRQSTTVFS